MTLPKARSCLDGEFALLAFEFLMDFVSSLGEKEKPTEQKDHVPARDLITEYLKERSGETDDPGQAEEESDAHEHRSGEADSAGGILLLSRQLAGQD